ncbi:phosphoserine aminotransferase [bacterium BMS3Bbin02]|nr:phosphoserine aminotransferase [bacterium BMS3Bbin02]
MSQHPDFTIPADYLPRDGRLGSGPSLIRGEALDSLATSGRGVLGTSHRQAPVKNLVGSIRSRLAEFYHLPGGFEVMLGVGGATSFWDAAVVSLIERKSQHVVCGEFSGKFAAATHAAPHLEVPSIIEVAPGQGGLPSTDPSVDAYCLIHNETSTGVANELGRPEGPGITLIDGTSAAGAMPIDLAATDIYYFSPQKALGSEGGLWLAICSPAGIERIEATTRTDRWIPASLSLKTALDNSRKNQTYNTPAISTLWFLDQQLGWMLERGGLTWATQRSLTSSGTLYNWAETHELITPFVAPEFRSPTVVTLDIDDRVNADDVVAVCRSNGILDIGGYRKLGRNQLRIACFPGIEPTDIELTTKALDYVIERLAGI